MSEFAAEYGVSDAVDGDAWGWVAGRESVGSADAPTELARQRAETAIINEMIREIPHLRRYAGALTRNATEKDDLVQDCLVRALSSIGQFQAGTDVRRWLFAILRNLFIDEKRKEARRNHHVRLIDRDCQILVSPQLSHLHLKEVKAAVGRLRPAEQEVILLSLSSGTSHQTIADQMQVSVGTVKSRLSRARAKLRQEAQHGSNRAPVERQAGSGRVEAAQ